MEGMVCDDKFQFLRGNYLLDLIKIQRESDHTTKLTAAKAGRWMSGDQETGGGHTHHLLVSGVLLSIINRNFK